MNPQVPPNDDNYTECHLAEHLVYGDHGAFCPCVSEERIAEWRAYMDRLVRGVGL